MGKRGEREEHKNPGTASEDKSPTTRSNGGPSWSSQARPYKKFHGRHDQTVHLCPRSCHSSPLSTNHIAGAHCTRAQRYSWAVKQIVSPQLAPSVGMACTLAQEAAELSLCQARVYEGAFITSNKLLLFQHKFPLGAMLGSAKGTGNSRGFQHQVNPSPPGSRG